MAVHLGEQVETLWWFSIGPMILIIQVSETITWRIRTWTCWVKVPRLLLVMSRDSKRLNWRSLFLMCLTSMSWMHPKCRPNHLKWVRLETIPDSDITRWRLRLESETTTWPTIRISRKLRKLNLRYQSIQRLLEADLAAIIVRGRRWTELLTTYHRNKLEQQKTNLSTRMCSLPRVIASHCVQPEVGVQPA